MNLLHGNQLFNEVLLQSTNLERKHCVWSTSRLLGMCIVPQIETKSVFIFQPTKRLVSTTVKSAKPAATF